MAIDNLIPEISSDSNNTTVSNSVLTKIEELAYERLSSSSTVTDFKQYLNATSQMLDSAFDQKHPVEDLLNGRALAVDLLLIEIWEQCSHSEQDKCALIAVGGFGRSELHPYSDIDLLILTPKEDDLTQEVKDSLSDFITHLWDLGLDIGHSVRDLDACMDMAKSDVTVMTNLLESRLIAGRVELFDELSVAIEKDDVWPSDEFFTAKYQEQRNRHEKFKKTSYALEPNIKKSPGALRDIQLVDWVTKRHFKVDGLKDLIEENFVTGHEYQTLHESELYLWRLRFALHQVAGRGEDRLLFDHQKPVAEKMGYRDSTHMADVEHLMQDYYKVVRTIRELNDMLLQHFSETILAKGEDSAIVPIDENFQRHGIQIEARSDDLFLKDPVKLLQLFLYMAEDKEIRGIRAPTLRQIFIARKEIDLSAFQNNPESKKLFLDILKHPNGMTRAFTYMKRYGVLRTYLPTYARIVGQMQFDLFHIYTVDEHTLFVMNNIDSFSKEESKEQFPLCHEVMSQIPQRELLLLGGLFHDIGKGQGGDHSEIGAVEARKFCKSHGLNKKETDLVVWLVADHLIMSMTAQRKDITDPEVIHQFASRVGSVECLNYIYLLTVADICATSHSLWNNWKDTLLSDLYKLTSNALERGLENPLETDEIINEVKREAIDHIAQKGYETDQIETIWHDFKDDYFIRNPVKRISWQTRQLLKNDTNSTIVSVYHDRQTMATEVFVYMPKHERYFTQITSLIHKKNLSIQDASLHSTEAGFILGSFVILESDGSAISDHRRAQSLKHLLAKKLKRNELEDSEGLQKPHHRYQHFNVPTEITFDISENGRRTLVELSTLDRPGLLAEIGFAFLECEVELHSAKVVTLGEKVEDVFSVTNLDESLLSGQQQLNLKMAMLDRLE